MTRQVLIVTVLLLSLYSSDSRPQQNVFSRVAGPGSGDIIEQTRTQMDSLKNTIIFLTRKPEAAPLLEKVFAGRNTCINNIEEAIEAIETTTRMVENAGPELKMLVEYVQEFSKIQDISMSEVVRQSAKIIGLLDALIPKLSLSSSSCKPSSAEDLLSMRNLKSVLIDLSTKDDLYYTPQVRQTLTNSADILSKATTFLEKESHFTFEHFCTEDMDHNKEFIGAVSNMMGDLAELYTELGGDIAAEGIKKQQDFAKKLLVSYANYFMSWFIATLGSILDFQLS